MSYDLFFQPSPSLTKQAFLAYFAARPLYRVEGDQAFYENPDTGVYFSFDWHAPAADESAEAHSPVAFNLNYVRPHVFGLEAEPEVAAFVRHFGLGIDDPQTEGMGDTYSAEGFLRGWNHGNRFGVRAVAGRFGPKGLLGVSESLIRNSWRWNLQRERLQAQLGEEIFVPKIMYLDVDGAVRTFAVWPDGCPVALPRVDLVVLARDRLVPWRVFKRAPDTAVATWDEAQDVLMELVHHTAPLEHWRLDYFGEPPPAVQSWFKSRRGSGEQLKDRGLSLDKLLDEALVREAIASPPQIVTFPPS